MKSITKDIRTLQEFHAVLATHSKRGGAYATPMKKAIGTALSCMERHKPIALIKFDIEEYEGICPECGTMCDTYSKYCNICGQAIDVRLSACIATSCVDCSRNNGYRVCDYYADKVDEIRRIHEGE